MTATFEPSASPLDVFCSAARASHGLSALFIAAPALLPCVVLARNHHTGANRFPRISPTDQLGHESCATWFRQCEMTAKDLREFPPGSFFYLRSEYGLAWSRERSPCEPPSRTAPFHQRTRSAPLCAAGVPYRRTWPIPRPRPFE